MRAAIYTRISVDREGSGIGVGRQEAECRRLAQAHQMEVVEVFEDNSISAYSGATRPRYQEMLEAVKAGSFDCILAWGHDRLTRHPRELEDLVDVLNATGTKVQTVVSGEYDLSTADGRGHARIVGAIARQESEKKSERVKAAKRAQTASGQMSGGRRAFGWTDSRREFVPEEIAVVIELGRRVLSGEALTTMVKDLNARGIKTSQGGEWSRASLRKLLTNPATAGLRRQPDGGVIEGDWPGAWDREQWSQIVALLEDPARRTTHRLRSFLLTGMVTDLEGRKLVTGYDSRGRTYRSNTTMGPVTGGVSISADLVEAVVVGAVLEITDNLKLDSKTADSKTDPVLEIQAELDTLAELYGLGEITAGEWTAARGPLQERLSEARRSRSAAPRISEQSWAQPGLLRRTWDGLTVAQQRSTISVFVRQVRIRPAKVGARSQDAGRVEIVWQEPAAY